MDRRRTKSQLIVELEQAQKRVAELEALNVSESVKRLVSAFYADPSPVALGDCISGAIGTTEAYSRGMVETSRVSMCRWLPDTTLTYANHPYRQMFGVQGDALGQKWLDFLPEETRAATSAFYEEIAQNPRIVAYEHSVTLQDGRLREYQWVDMPILDAYGNTIEFQSMGVDITERKHTEQTLHESDALFRSFVEQSVDGFMLTDEQGVIVECNRAFLQIIGLPREQVLGMTLWGLQARLSVRKDGSVEEQSRLFLQEILQTGQSPYLGLIKEVEIEIGGGKRRYIQQNSFSIRTMSGYRVGAVVRDVTDRKRMEAALEADIAERKRAEEQLRESEKRFRAFADFTYDMEYWLDENQQLLYMSPSCQRITGYDRDDFMSEPSRLEAIVHPLDRDAYQRHLTREYQTPGTLSLDFRIITAQGEVRWINHTCQSVFDEARQFRGVRASNRDITDRKQSEVQIHQQMEDLALVNLLNEAANRGESLETIAKIFSEQFRHIFHCKDAGIYLLSPDGQSLEMQAITFSENLRKRIEKIIGRPIPKIRIPLAPGSFFMDVIHSERGLITNDPQAIQRWMMEFAETPFLPDAVRPVVKALVPGIFKLLGIRSMITLPLKTSDKVLGAVEISSGNLFSEHDLERFQNVRASLTEIIRRKQVELELMASEEKYRGLMESLNNVISTVDFDGRFLYVNDMGAERLGITAQQLIGKRMDELFPEPYASLQLAAIQDSFRTDREAVFEAQSMDQDGLRWFRFALQPLHNDAGQVVQVLINATDIHDLKTAQEELQELNRTLEERVKQRTAEVQDLYDNAPVGYHSLNTHRQLVAINRTEAEMLGYTREELLGQPVDRVFAPQSMQALADGFRRLMADGKVVDLEMAVQRKDGATFPVLINAIAVYDENGQFLSSRCTMTDITRRKQAENELQRAMNFTNALLDAIPTPVFYKDKAGRYQGCNRAFTEIIGKTPEEIRGKTTDQLWSREKADLYREKDFELLQNGKQQVYESVVTDRRGSTRQVIFIKDVFRDESGEVAGLVGAFIDISDRKQAEETLRHANLELARAMRMKDEFLANMSHELRTPLNGILGLSEALQLQTYSALSDRQLHALANIENSGKHLLSLINDILDLSKIEAGKLEVHLETVTLADVCQSSLAFIREAAAAKDLSITLVSDPMITTLRADLRRLKQILVNLLSNAVKFTPTGGKIILQVQSDIQQRMVVFSVIDTGIGIAPQDQERLFNPFTQVDSSLTRKHEGTGLGLALVKELAELHGGHVQLHSEPGKGSAFTVSLPWQPEGEDRELLTPLAPGSAGPAPMQESQGVLEKILLADDAEINNMTVGDYLESKGYQMLFAQNGLEAIQQAQAHHPALILMDVQMPVLDGLEAIRRLRGEPRFASLPIIALTAMAMAGDEQRCIEAGATAYVSKPVGLKQLAELVRNLLDASKAESYLE